MFWPISILYLFLLEQETERTSVIVFTFSCIVSITSFSGIVSHISPNLYRMFVTMFVFTWTCYNISIFVIPRSSTYSGCWFSLSARSYYETRKCIASLLHSFTSISLFMELLFRTWNANSTCLVIDKLM